MKVQTAAFIFGMPVLCVAVWAASIAAHPRDTQPKRVCVETKTAVEAVPMVIGHFVTIMSIPVTECVRYATPHAADKK